jgi:hypothetical protein
MASGAYISIILFFFFLFVEPYSHQGTIGIFQGTVGIIQGTIGIIQGSVGIIQATVGILVIIMIIKVLMRKEPMACMVFRLGSC